MKLLVTKGIWYEDIINGVKKFDFRKGFRNFFVNNIITFVEANSLGIPTGRECKVKVNYVLNSTEFPPHFGWVATDFTIFQFELLVTQDVLKQRRN